MQDLNINQLKLEVHDTYKKDEKITTNFEAVDNEDVINKGHLDSKLLKIDGHLSKLEKDYNEFKNTIQQTKCRRYFNSKSCENNDTNTLW